MKAKHFIFILVGLALVTGVGYFLLRPEPHGRVDAEKVFTAAQTYSRQFKAGGAPVPPSVSLEELISKGLLKREDVSGFEGIEVTVYLMVNKNQPQSVLMRARLPDGHEAVVLTDGTVQTP
jgi:hypothetical protein